jgi:hypothetical protein
MLGAALIHPDKREVMPLMPESIVKPDGATKNDCERNAAKRFIAKFRQDYPDLKVIVTEDSLSSNAPHIEMLHAHDVHCVFHGILPPNPQESCHPIHGKAATDSTGKLPLIPWESCHAVHVQAATPSGTTQPRPIGAQRRTRVYG